MDGLILFEYLSILLRRKTVFLLVSGLIFALSVIYAAQWSSYSTFATVEVVQPKIALELSSSANAGSTMEALADLQISRIRQKVLSTNSLIEIITKLNLYSNARKHTPIAYIAEEMRENIKIELLSTSLANPQSARKASALQLSAIAFMLSFKYNNPLLTQQTVNELVSRFLNEDLKDRRNTAKRTSEFLDTQMEVLLKSLTEQEKKIATFRSENGDVRPEALAFNQQAAASMMSNSQSIESQIISNIGLQGALRSQLAQTDPYSRLIENGQFLTTPSVQLKSLQSKYATLTAKYGAAHPDVLKVSRQIEAMQGQLGSSGHTANLKTNIDDVAIRLQVLQETYGSTHPDVVSLRNQLKSLKTQLYSSNKTRNSASSKIKKDADNPAYLQIIAKLEAAQKQQSALKSQKRSMTQQQQKYQTAISKNPATEQRLSALTRDYDNSLLLYRDLKAKKLAADMNEAIEQGHNGRRFSIINSPELPLRTKPARILFIFAGLILAVIGGLASVFALHILRNPIIGSHNLEAIIGVAPLVTIPHLKTLDEKIYIKKILFKIIGILPILIIIGLIAFSLFIMPLDVFWTVLTQRLGL